MKVKSDKFKQKSYKKKTGFDPTKPEIRGFGFSSSMGDWAGWRGDRGFFCSVLNLIDCVGGLGRLEG